METLTEQFEARVAGFLWRTSLTLREFGLQGTGDPKFSGNLRRGHSPKLATAESDSGFHRDLRPGSPGLGLAWRQAAIGFSLEGERNRSMTKACGLVYYSPPGNLYASSESSSDEKPVPYARIGMRIRRGGRPRSRPPGRAFCRRWHSENANAPWVHLVTV